MKYKIMMANGDHMFDTVVDAVDHIHVEQETYVLKDVTGTKIFTAPLNSVVYIKQI